MPNASDFTAPIEIASLVQRLSGPNQFDGSSVIRFWLWTRSATGNSADRSGHLSTDVVTSSLKRTGNLRSNPAPTGARAFSILVSSMPGIWHGDRQSEPVELSQEPLSP
jgi:hypothetical protein